MQGPFLRKYGVETKLDFVLYATDGASLKTDASHASGDSVIMKDEGAETNTSNGFVDEGSGYSITLTATEMQAARIVVYIVDQTSPKVWLDTALIIETYGNASAQHAFDLDDAEPDVNVAKIGDQALITGAVDDSTPGTEIIDTDLPNTTSGAYVGMLLMFTSGSLAGLIRCIASSYSGSGSGATLALRPLLPSAPADEDEFILLSGSVTPAFIADVVWEETLSDHISQATYAGWFLDTIYDKVATDGVVLADNAVSDAKVASDMDTYQAKIWLIDDDANTADRYVVVFFKNGEPVTSGVTSPTIQVIQISDGSDLVGATSLSQIASTGLYKYEEATSRISDGAGYVVKVQATIDAATRTWYQPIGRDG